MSEFSDLGRLVNLPLESITPAEGFSAPSFLGCRSRSSAKGNRRSQLGAVCWWPRLATTSTRPLATILSTQLLERPGWRGSGVSLSTQLRSRLEQAQILAREVVPKVNLTEAPRETILAALRYLAEQPGTPLKGVDVTIAAARIAEADRSWWQDLTPITKLGCKITRGKKLEALKEVFFLAPTAPPPSQKKSSKKSTASARAKKTSATRSRKKKEG
jgi:hypothetical protein